MTPTIASLRKTYTEFNAKYFNNELPTALKIEVSPRLTRALGTAYYRRDWFGNITPVKICLSTHYEFLNEKQIANVLCHEMVHIWQYINDKADGHGYWFLWKAREIAKQDSDMIITIRHDESINGKCESVATSARVIVWTHKGKYLFAKVNPNKVKYFTEELIDYLKGDTQLFGVFDAYGSFWGAKKTCQTRLCWYEFSEEKFMEEVYPTLTKEVA